MFGGVIGGAAALPAADYLGRLGIDFALPLRHALFGPLHAPERSPTVVIALDEQTYRTAPFNGTPKVAWTPHLGDVIDAVVKADAKIVGLDLVYPTSLDREALLPGYDRSFLMTLARHGRAGKVVLGEVRLSRQAIAPARRQVLAVGGAKNVRLLNMFVDQDNVVRRYPTAFNLKDGTTTPSMAAELIRRAGAQIPAGEFLINYNTGANAVPSFSFVDLWTCARRGETDFFAQ